MSLVDIIEVLAPASHDAYEPPQAEEVVLVEKMLTWSESVFT